MDKHVIERYLIEYMNKEKGIGGLYDCGDVGILRLYWRRHWITEWLEPLQLPDEVITQMQGKVSAEGYTQLSDKPNVTYRGEPVLGVEIDRAMWFPQIRYCLQFEESGTEGVFPHTILEIV